MAIVGNKDDMYEYESLDDNEAIDLTNDLKGIFHKISFIKGKGIDDLFLKLGKKFVNPKFEIDNRPMNNYSKININNEKTKSNKKLKSH